MYCLSRITLVTGVPAIVVVVVVVVVDTTGSAGGSTMFTTTVLSTTTGTVVVVLPGFAGAVLGGTVPDTTCAKHSEFP